MVGCWLITGMIAAGATPLRGLRQWVDPKWVRHRTALLSRPLIVYVAPAVWTALRVAARWPSTAVHPAAARSEAARTREPGRVWATLWGVLPSLARNRAVNAADCSPSSSVAGSGAGLVASAPRRRRTPPRPDLPPTSQPIRALVPPRPLLVA